MNIYLHACGKNVTLKAQQFYDWSVEGRADANFKYAVAQLPTATGFAHVVSIVKSKDSDDLILIDSNLRGTRLLRNVASEDRYRWFTTPTAYIVIREKA